MSTEISTTSCRIIIYGVSVAFPFMLDNRASDSDNTIKEKPEHFREFMNRKDFEKLWTYMSRLVFGTSLNSYIE